LFRHRSIVNPDGISAAAVQPWNEKQPATSATRGCRRTGGDISRISEKIVTQSKHNRRPGAKKRLFAAFDAT